MLKMWSMKVFKTHKNCRVYVTDFWNVQKHRLFEVLVISECNYEHRCKQTVTHRLSKRIVPQHSCCGIIVLATVNYYHYRKWQRLFRKRRETISKDKCFTCCLTKWHSQYFCGSIGKDELFKQQHKITVRKQNEWEWLDWCGALCVTICSELKKNDQFPKAVGVRMDCIFVCQDEWSLFFHFIHLRPRTFTWKTSSLPPTLNWDSNRMVNFSSVTDSAPRLSDRLILFRDYVKDKTQE